MGRVGAVFVLAQEAPSGAAGLPFETWGLVVSAVAVVVALGSAALTIAQGAAIRKIETREHEWQAEDRESAHIEVTRMNESVPDAFVGAARYSRRAWIRLRNTGRALAEDVVWSDIEGVGDRDVIAADRRRLDQLHPGEHFDLRLIQVMGDPDEAEFSVSWTDETGPHTTTRIINL